PLTVDGVVSKAAATLSVPPSSSITRLAVSSMEPLIVRSVRTCQEFATRETTFPPLHVPLGGMLTDPPEIIGPRLKALRIACGIKSQVAFAKAIGVEKNTYNP